MRDRRLSARNRESPSYACDTLLRMDILFSPWRYGYMHEPKPEGFCALCHIQSQARDENNFILHRGQNAAVVLNLYPYTTGHLMIFPLRHLADLNTCTAAARTEIIELASRAEAALQSEYHPDGMNLGINLGRAAGAGIVGHLHLHVVPRWQGDANFVSVIGETRVIPEDLVRTYARLRPYFNS